MRSERALRLRNRHSLAPLLDHTDLLIERGGSIRAPEKMPVPMNAHGIPQVDDMVEQLLDQMHTPDYIWTGTMDEHHMATPKADYNVLRTRDEPIGSLYRGLPILKVELPRQMHNLAHAVFELPGRPSIELARQAIHEVNQLRDLQAIINSSLYSQEQDDAVLIRQLCLEELRATINEMSDGEVGIMPSREELLLMDLEDLMRTVGCILRVRRRPEKRLIHPVIRRRKVQFKTAA